MWEILGIISLAAIVVGIIGMTTLVVIKNDTWKKWLLGTVIALMIYIVILNLAPPGS